MGSYMVIFEARILGENGGIKKSSFVVSAIYKDKYGIKINKTLWLYHHVLCF
jgi:hypothetical protein